MIQGKFIEGHKWSDSGKVPEKNSRHRAVVETARIRGIQPKLRILRKTYPVDEIGDSKSLSTTLNRLLQCQSFCCECSHFPTCKEIDFTFRSKLLVQLDVLHQKERRSVKGKENPSRRFVRHTVTATPNRMTFW